MRGDMRATSICSDPPSLQPDPVSRHSPTHAPVRHEPLAPRPRRARSLATILVRLRMVLLCQVHLLNMVSIWMLTVLIKCSRPTVVNE